MDVQGPCLAHCYRCPPSALFLAHLSLVYLGASFGYLAQTRSLGTPFMDSLTDAQLAIKRESARARKAAFVHSALVAALLVAAWSPFRRLTTSA